MEVNQSNPNSGKLEIYFPIPIGSPSYSGQFYTPRIGQTLHNKSQKKFWNLVWKSGMIAKRD